MMPRVVGPSTSFTQDRQEPCLYDVTSCLTTARCPSSGRDEGNFAAARVIDGDTHATPRIVAVCSADLSETPIQAFKELSLCWAKMEKSGYAV